MQELVLSHNEAPFPLAIAVVDGSSGYARLVELANARATYDASTETLTLTVPIDVGGSHPNRRLLVTAPQHHQEIAYVAFNSVALCPDYQGPDYQGIAEPSLIWQADDDELPTCGGSQNLDIAWRSPPDEDLLSAQFGDFSLRERITAQRKPSESDPSVAALGGDNKHQVDSRDPAPPASGELILYHVLPPRYRDPVIGDLAEIHRDAVAKYGLRRANRIYWCQLLGAIVGLVPQKVWLALAGVGAWLLGKG